MTKKKDMMKKDSALSAKYNRRALYTYNSLSLYPLLYQKILRYFQIILKVII